MDTETLISELKPSSLYPAVLRFLDEQGFKKASKSVRKQTNQEFTSETEDNLLEIYKCYLKTLPKEVLLKKLGVAPTEEQKADKKSKKAEKKRKRQEAKKAAEESKEETAAAEEPDNKKQRKEEEKSDESTPQKTEETPKEDKKSKKKKKRKHEEASNGNAAKETDATKDTNAEESKEESNQKEAKENGKETKEVSNGNATKEESPKENGKEETKTVQSPETNNKKKEKKNDLQKPSTPFRRVDPATVQILDSRLADNSYYSKQGDEWGKKAAADLEVVKGKDFRHAKTKKKKGTYHGGAIDLGVNSFKFTYDDE